MLEHITLPAGYAVEAVDGGFWLAAELRCPLNQARSLAVTAALWVRNAIGGDAKIGWPNHVTVDGRRACAIECRAGNGRIMLTFRPDADVISAPLDAFAERVIRAAVDALEAYPENRENLLQAYCEHCVTVMKFVHSTYRGVPLYGFAFAVDKHGGLMVMTQESRTVVTLYGGEVRLAEKGEEPETPEVPIMPGR